MFMKQFDKTNYDKLNWYDKLEFDYYERVFLECNYNKETLNQRGIYHFPLIKEMNNVFRLILEPIDKSNRGTIKSYVDIKLKNHLFENEKKIKIANKLIENKSGYLFGSAGIGKSHIIGYVANELNKKGLSIYYELSATIAKKIWNFETQEETLNDLKKYDVVIVDDIVS